MKTHVLFGLKNWRRSSSFSNRELDDIFDFLSALLNEFYKHSALKYFVNSNGVLYFTTEDKAVLLKTNMFENRTLEEEDFPDYIYLLYLCDVAKHPEYLAAIQSRPDIFIELRTWHD